MTLLEFASSLAWPLTIIFFLLFFRNELKELFSRLKRMGATGAEFGEAALQEANVRYSAPTNVTQLRKVAGFDRSVAMQDLEVDLHQALLAYDVDSRIDILINQLALARLDLESAFVFAPIFANQVEFLKSLSERSMSRRRANDFFKRLKAADTTGVLSSWDSDQWLNYLFITNLIQITEGELALTPFGKHFIGFLGRRNLAKTDEVGKPGGVVTPPPPPSAASPSPPSPADNPPASP